MRELLRRAVVGALLVGLVGPGVAALAGCASQQWKFDNLEKRDKLRFAACRTDVRRHLCPDDPDCDVKAAQAYADERPDARLQWLLDHECPRNKILHADDTASKQEQERIGLPSENGSANE